jgi:hypothetical protein
MPIRSSNALRPTSTHLARGGWRATRRGHCLRRRWGVLTARRHGADGSALPRPWQPGGWGTATGPQRCRDGPGAHGPHPQEDAAQRGTAPAVPPAAPKRPASLFGPPGAWARAGAGGVRGSKKRIAPSAREAFPYARQVRFSPVRFSRAGPRRRPQTSPFRAGTPVEFLLPQPLAAAANPNRAQADELTVRAGRIPQANSRKLGLYPRLR